MPADVAKFCLDEKLLPCQIRVLHDIRHPIAAWAAQVSIPVGAQSCSECRSVTARIFRVGAHLMFLSIVYAIVVGIGLCGISSECFFLGVGESVAIAIVRRYGGGCRDR